MRKNFFKKVYFSFCIFVAAVTAVALFENYSLPDKLYVREGENPQNFSQFVKISENNVLSVSFSENEARAPEYKLLGIIPIKSVSILAQSEKSVCVCGGIFGIKMLSDGAIVVDVTGFESENGYISPAKSAGIQKGDIIKKINDTPIRSNEDFKKILNEEKESLNVSVQRGEENIMLSLTPRLCLSDNTYKSGMWVKDSTAGIGTITFFDPETGNFAGLGHGISEGESGVLVPLESGEIVGVSLIGVTKGVSGKAGQLQGYFNSGDCAGKALKNLEIGLYGKLDCEKFSGDCYPVALKQEIKKGSAQILTTVGEGGAELFDIKIEKIKYNASSNTKNMQIRIIDEDLLSKTGGIVRGMSGSPIIQNGKLVGAVTHVFLNDPERGYAIFAETMFEEAKSIP